MSQLEKVAHALTWKNATGAAQGAAKKGRENIKTMLKIVKKRFDARREHTNMRPALTNHLHDPKEEAEAATLNSMLEKMWAKDCEKLPVYKDVPRLVRRVSIMDENQNLLFSARDHKLEPGSISAATLVVMMFKTIAEHVEGDEQADLVYKVADELLEKVSEEVELEYFLSKLCNGIGLDSKTVQIVKCINQNVVGVSMYRLKMEVIREFMTKDVKGEDGWQVIITLGKYIQVRHKRREQSIDINGDARNHWEFDWNVSMTFDKEMKSMTDTRLTITELTMNEDIDKRLEATLRSKFTSGSLIVM